MKPSQCLHQLPDLFDVSASLLDRLGPVAGLRVGLHTRLPDGVRLLVRTGRPYTDEVGPLDRIGAVLQAQIVHQRTAGLGHARVQGTWCGVPVSGHHLYSDRPSTDAPCTQPAAEVAARVRALAPWARQDWARHAESVHVYDASSAPRVHVVLEPDGSLDDALAELLNATGPLQHRYEREHDYVAHGSVLLNDGTVVTAAVATP